MPMTQQENTGKAHTLGRPSPQDVTGYARLPTHFPRLTLPKKTTQKIGYSAVLDNRTTGRKKVRQACARRTFYPTRNNKPGWSLSPFLPPNATKPLSFCCVHCLPKKHIDCGQPMNAYGAIAPQNKRFVSFGSAPPPFCDSCKT